MSDGDGARIYVELESPSQLVMTDLGAVCMRLSYTTKLSKSLEEMLARLAETQGFSFEDGEFRAEITQNEMLPAALGLLQIQAQAEQLAARAIRRAQEGSEFRSIVREFLVEIFGEKSVEAPYVDSSIDKEGDYPLDALVRAKRTLAIASPTSDLSAERSVISKLKLEGSLPNARWIALPRDLEKLSRLTQRRFIRDFVPLGSSFERERDTIAAKVRDFAA